MANEVEVVVEVRPRCMCKHVYLGHVDAYSEYYTGCATVGCDCKRYMESNK